MKSRLLFILIFQILFLGCSLDDHGPDAGKNLKKNIVGKWEFESWGTWPVLEPAFMEFTENGDVILFDSQGLETFDKYNVTSESTISVNKVVSLKYIEIKDKRITFYLTRKTGTDFIVANKADTIDSEKTRLLTSTNWKMLNELNGKDTLKYLSKATIRFTNSGTCLGLATTLDSYIISNYYTWKWHPTVPERILLTRYRGFPIKEEDRFLTVKNVTETSLSLSETKRQSVKNYEYVPDK